MDIAEEVADSVRAHPTVCRVDPVGSPARETGGRRYRVTAEDFGHLASDLRELLRPHEPLAAQWDPLSEFATYLLILPGPSKVDLLFPDVPRSANPPWRVGPDTLAAMDAHFWDWILWLIGKRHMADRVRGELLKLSRHILEPLGISVIPPTLEDAATRYIRARNRLETRYGLHLSRRLEQEILPLVRDHDRDHFRPSGLPS
ncbi:hypothetical protein [Actinomadura rubrisoli]|uniref:Uncharacterized protein n=1 Tax=Actinomadura rubrisoli TaxID=2530368 RepID=A0A4R5AQ36_9ACTN|nr:hypothetical protein [Actinomadura rubrisoli]TDD73829.1 hypothetical protein E1298_33295 [Actinomadura rubrisoli]